MGLVEQRQRVQQGVERRAEDTTQGEEAQQGEEGDVRMAKPLSESTSAGIRGSQIRELGKDGEKCQKQRQQPQVRAAFDVVLDAPVDVLAVAERLRGRPTPGEEVEVAVVGRVAKEVGDGEGEQSPLGIGLTQHLLEARGRSSPTEAATDHLEVGHKLHRTQRQAQCSHQRQPRHRPAGTNQPANQLLFVCWFVGWLA